MSEGIPEVTRDDHYLDLEYWYVQADKSRRNEVTEPSSSKTGANYHMPGWNHRASFHRDAEGTVQTLIRLLTASRATIATLTAKVAALEAAGDEWQKMAVKLGTVITGLIYGTEWEIAPSIKTHMRKLEAELSKMLAAAKLSDGQEKSP